MQSQVQTREVSKESRQNNGSQWDLLPVSKVLCIETGLYGYHRRSHDCLLSEIQGSNTL
jgi:hypothetical protein